MRLLTRRGPLTAFLVLGASVIGVAFATWTATGTGSGRAEAISATASAVTTRNGTADLYPG